jgi:hypothetical protein
MRRHDTYCSHSSCSPETLAEGSSRSAAREAPPKQKLKTGDKQTLLCRAVARFPQLAVNPESRDPESSIAAQQNADMPLSTGPTVTNPSSVPLISARALEHGHPRVAPPTAPEQGSG